jgi:hypothetical protein
VITGLFLIICLSGDRDLRGHKTQFGGVMDIGPSRRALEYGAMSPSPIRDAETERL